MYESRHKQVVPFHIFAKRFLLNLFVGFMVILVCLFIGMLGYHYFETMSWIDAYLNASMILSGMGPVQELKTDGGKFFAGSYALFSGIIFLFLIAMILTPILHRFYHKFHLKEDDKSQSNS